MPSHPASSEFQITLTGRLQARFAARQDLTLLQSALAALPPQQALPSSCRNGTCRACQCKLLQGRIEYSIDWPGLSREEKAEGWLLPCVALPRSDLILRFE